jgi:hypothetical protein
MGRGESERLYVEGGGAPAWMGTRIGLPNAVEDDDDAIRLVLGKGPLRRGLILCIFWCNFKVLSRKMDGFVQYIFRTVQRLTQSTSLPVRCGRH